MTKRGIFLVANFKSQDMCENLVYSIRASNCTLPIRVVHFGGKEINSKYLLSQVELIHLENFSDHAKMFIDNLKNVLTDCPVGFLYRFLGWYMDWEEFIYSDNDIVALCNWEKLFDYMDGYNLVHADEEYITHGVYNYNQPDFVKKIFGEKALESAITAGHIVVRPNLKMIQDLNNAIEWFKQHPHVPKKHDQSLLHIASLLGNWKVLNLCRPPYNWLSSWAGDYKNSLDIIQKIQAKDIKITHIHYSGNSPKGNLAIQDLLFSSYDDKERLNKLFIIGIKFISQYNHYMHQYTRAKNYIIRKIRKKPVL